MKFLHAADLHLDRSFEGLIDVADSFQPYLLQANQQMLTNLVDTAIKETVDFVLLAGDTFHQNRPTLKTQRYFFSEMERLQQAEIPVFMNFGNHDYYQAERYWFTFPDNIVLFTKETVETKRFTTKAGEDVAVSSFSFQHPTIEQEMLPQFPVKNSGTFHIGMYHGGQMPYAPFTVAKLIEKGYDYWALGHIHVPQILSEHPWIVYPGTPQGHTQKETQLSGIQLVEKSDGFVKVRSIPIAEVQWKKQRVSLAHVRNNPQLFQAVKEQVQFSQPTLLQIELTDGETLGSELRYQVASSELRMILQEELPEQIFLWQLTMTDTSEERPYLAVDEVLVDQLLTTYEEPQVFQALLQELDQNPAIHPLLTNQFKQEVIEELAQTLKESYRFRKPVSSDETNR
ncbi:DNA repair exonuclease [Candidatus Enterococcus ferrettii]|uniref:DNA repair protein SbcD/Mre11 n=1 Tax=Candidatus Enterococcus ferrettii TaxID=2815324 RepID=A0ABV0EIQ2_9ENTE|nr:DNA repair exonuclease [Enterococcus sp. 665A]MBO1342955.1 metallophosphoesterase [Enterococcus sp. 665A]